MNRLSSSAAFRLSALFGFLGVALGAFGAHALKALLARNQTTTVWETAVLYHLIHAVVLLVIATIRPLQKSAWICFCAGVLTFSGSLYVYALTQVRWVNFVTPLGGVFLLAGWLVLIRHPPSSPTVYPDPP